MTVEINQKWYGDDILKDIQNSIPVALKDAAEFLLDEALKRVPIEDGTLANSGNTSVNKNEAFVTFDTPYAIRQHEDLTLHHKNGRSAKYVERPARENQKKIETIIADTLKDKVK